MQVNENSPEYRATHRGFDALTNSEILSIFLNGNVQRALKLLNTFGSLYEISVQSIEVLEQYITRKQAIKIKAVFALSSRCIVPKRVRVTESEKVYDMFNDLKHTPHEEGWVVFLDRNNNVLKREKMFVGGVAQTTLDPQKVFRRALELRASGVILVHNHPSGNLYPSDSDISVTRIFKEIGKILDIEMLDHVIITYRGYYSFADEGRI